MRTRSSYQSARNNQVKRTIVISAALLALVLAPLVYSLGIRPQRQGSLQTRTGAIAPARAGRVVQSGGTASQRRVSAEGMRQIGALLAEKELRTPTQQKIDSQLLQAVRETRGEQMAAGVQLQRADPGADDSGRLLVDISAQVSDSLILRIQSLGGEIIYPSREYKTIRARINLLDTETIAGYPEVTFIQPAVGSQTNGMLNDSGRGSFVTPVSGSRSVYPSFAERAASVRNRLLNYLAPPATAPYFTGNFESEGDRTHRADDVRSTYGFAGEGVRIGVLSDSFNSTGHLPNIIAQGDLPGPGNPLGNLTPVTVVQDFGPGGTDEGAAMLQIIHDLAPKAQLFFATADLSEAGFATNILALRNAPNNCDIIIDDVGYFDEPPFQDGIVAQAVNTVTASGALYFSSAGNNGSVAKNTAGVWEGDFNDAGSTLIIPGNTKSGTVLNFGTSSSPIEGDTITVAGRVNALSWSDPQGASSNDYDLFLMDSTLTTVKASSTNIQNGTQNPFEAVGGGSANDRLVVFKSSGAAVRAISLNTNRGTLAVATAGQTHGHSAAVDAFSVAATPAANAIGANSPFGPFPNPFSSLNKVENFSSDGPRQMFYNADGTPITPGNVLFGSHGGAVRSKPDLTAADGVSIFPPSSTFSESRFFGTSAAAPHAGAIAALLKSANPSLTPQQIRNILTSTALDIESPGPDNISGFGIIQAFQAMQAVQPTETAHLALGTVTATEGAFSNHNGAIDPGETVNLVITLNNPTQVPVTNVKATLLSFNSGLKVLDSRSSVSYGTIAPASGVSNAGSPFLIGLKATLQCGFPPTGIFLAVSFDGDASPQQFTVPVNVSGQQLSSIPASLGQPPLTNPTFGSVSEAQTGILKRDGTASSCSTTGATPTLADTSGSRTADAYSFFNSSADQCVTITMTSPNGANLYTAAYADSYNNNDPTANFLGAAGSSSNQQSFSVMAKFAHSLVVVVHEISPGGGVGSPYSLSVSLNTSLTVCAPPPACNLAVSPTSIPGGALGTPYSQTFTGTGGSGFLSLTETALTSNGIPPAGLAFSGATLSGTPTQAGVFPFSVNLNDLVCPTFQQQYTLSIPGDLPATVTATAGDGQVVGPNTTLPIRLKATVRDSANKPLPGVAVLFAIAGEFLTPPGSFSGSSTVITDANGIATAPPFTTSSVFGTFVIQAQVSGLPPASFNLTNSSVTVVTNNADSGPGSLRDAVSNIGRLGLITFAPNVTGTIALTSGEIVTTDGQFTIQGPGANILAISGSHKSRIFTFNQSCFVLGSPCNIPGNSEVKISGLTLRDGSPSKTDTPGGGGALLLDRTIFTITDSVIINNDASNTAFPSGGGIEAIGSQLNITRSSIINNTATQKGGGIHLIGTSDLTLTDSTVAGNSAGSAGRGGGIELDDFSDIQAINSTIFGNSANIGGNVSDSNPQGSLVTGNNLTVITNSIFAGGVLLGSSPMAADIDNIQFSGPKGDFNLIQDATALTFTGTPHNITGVSPMLLPLGNYGGPSPTMLPLPNSPVINAGAPAVPDDQDQRGFSRRQSGQADIGAVGTNYSLTISGGSPQSTAIKTAFATPLQTTVMESGLNVTGVSTTFTAPASGASGLFGTATTATVTSNSAGVATAPALTANSIGGPFTVLASIGAAVPAVPYSLTNIVPATVSATGGTSQNALPGTAFQALLQATVRDSSSNPLQGISVTFAAPGSGPSGTFAGGMTIAVVTTDANGVATAPAFTANSISGSYIVTASVGGNVPPASFNLRNINPGPPATIAATGGTPQSRGIGNRFGTPLQATVLDTSGVPVGGVTVTFTVVPNSSAGAQFPNGASSVTAMTDIDGHATAPALTTNQFIGSYTATASAVGITPIAVFNLTNTFIVGDIDGSGAIDSADLVFLANALAGNVSLTTGQGLAADVFDDHTGQINAADLVTLANFLAGNIVSLPVVTASGNSSTPPLAPAVAISPLDWGKSGPSYERFDLTSIKSPVLMLLDGFSYWAD